MNRCAGCIGYDGSVIVRLFVEHLHIILLTINVPSDGLHGGVLENEKSGYAICDDTWERTHDSGVQIHRGV